MTRNTSDDELTKAFKSKKQEYIFNRAKNDLLQISQSLDDTFIEDIDSDYD